MTTTSHNEDMTPTITSDLPCWFSSIVVARGIPVFINLTVDRFAVYSKGCPVVYLLQQDVYS